MKKKEEITVKTKFKQLVSLTVTIVFLIGVFLTHPVVSDASTDGIVLNGRHQYLTVGSGTEYDLTGKVSVDVWVKLNDVSRYQGIVSKIQSGSYGMSINANGNFVWAVHVGGEYRRVYSDEKAQIGKWYHLTGTYDGNKSYLYVDEKLQSQVQEISGSIKSTSNVPLTMGTNPSTWGSVTDIDYLNGNIREVRIWDKALSTSEVTSNATKTMTGSESGLIGNWIFDGVLHNVPNKVANGENAFAFGYTPDLASTDGLTFNSSQSQYIELKKNNAYNSGKFTVEAWFRPTDFSGARAIVSNTQSSGNSIYTSSGGVLRANATIGGTSVTLTGLQLNTNQWYHVATTYDGSTYELWLDGERVATASASGNLTPSTVDMYIGGQPTTTDRAPSGTQFSGNINEIRYWNYARSKFDIQHYSIDDVKGVESGLVGLWDLDSFTTGRVYDKTPTTNHGNSINFPDTNTSITGSSIDDLGLTANWGKVVGAISYYLTRDDKEAYKGTATSYKDDLLVSDTTYNYTLTPIGVNGEAKPVSAGLKTAVGSLDIVQAPTISLSNVLLNGKSQTTNGSFSGKLIVKDTRKTRSAWTVTLSASQLKDSGGRTLPLNSLTVVKPANIVLQRASGATPTIATANMAIDNSNSNVVVRQTNTSAYGIYEITLAGLQLNLGAGTTKLDPSTKKSDYSTSVKWSIQ